MGSPITADAVPGKRSAGSLSWGGGNNTYYWLDPTRGITGVILMQFRPFADCKVLALYDAFERVRRVLGDDAFARSVARTRAPIDELQTPDAVLAEITALVECPLLPSEDRRSCWWSAGRQPTAGQETLGPRSRPASAVEAE